MAKKQFNVVVNDEGIRTLFYKNLPQGQFPTYEEALNAYHEIKRKEHNQARRERHAALTGLGLKRVKGALGGVYYE